MPSRLERRYGCGQLHFVTASCYRRRRLLASPLRCDLFERVLEDVRNRYQFVVVGYVVMPEHFHLLISEPMIGTVSVVIQALKLGIVQRQWPSAHALPSRRRVRFWQRRFYDFNVWSMEKRIEKLRYLHRNPVRRKFVENPEDWKWSSYRAYAFCEPGLVTVNDWSVLKLRKKEARHFGDQTPIFSASRS